MIIAIVKLGDFISPRNSQKRFLVIPFCLRSLAFLKETPEDLILFQRISFSWVIKTSVKVRWNTWLKGPFLLCLKQVIRVALCLDVGSLVCKFLATSPLLALLLDRFHLNMRSFTRKCVLLRCV